MGCFNIMGFHSHLPIIYDNDIFILLGVRANYKNRNVKEDTVTFSPGSDFTPIALPIFGKYNDYGSIMDIEKDNNISIIERFFGTDIDKIISLTDDYMHGRYLNDEEASMYDAMCEKVYDLQPSFWQKSEFCSTYEVVFIMDHRFVFETIKDLGGCGYNFEKSFDAVMEFNPPWLTLDADFEKLEENNKNYADGKITEREYELIKNRNSYMHQYDGWFNYLNSGKYYWDKDYLVNINPYSQEDGMSRNFWKNIDMFDNNAVMGVYKTTDAVKSLFTELKQEYIDFLEFTSEFKTHLWCFRYHVYGSQETHCTTALPFYEKMVEFCKSVAEGREEEIRQENEAWEREKNNDN